MKRKKVKYLIGVLTAGCVLIGDAGGVLSMSAQNVVFAQEAYSDAGEEFFEDDAAMEPASGENGSLEGVLPEDVFAEEDPAGDGISELDFAEDDLIDLMEDDLMEDDPETIAIDEQEEDPSEDELLNFGAVDADGWIEDDLSGARQDETIFEEEEECELRPFTMKASFDDPLDVAASGGIVADPEWEESVLDCPALYADGDTGAPAQDTGWFYDQLDDISKIFYTIRYEHFCAQKRTDVLIREYNKDTTPTSFNATFLTETVFNEETQEYTTSYIIDRSTEEYRAGYEGVLYRMRAAFDAFCYDHPEVFWTRRMETRFSFGGLVNKTTGIVKVYLKKVTITPVEAFAGSSGLVNEFDTAVDAAAAMISAESDYNRDGALSENELLQGIHDYICDTVYYDHSGLGVYNNNGGDLYIFTPCGVFLPQYGTGVVCEGYSRSFKILCEKLGLSTVLVSGKASAGSTEGHMWNAVSYGGAWYLTDATWDDENTTGKKYTYFMCGSLPGRIEDGQLSGGDNTDPDTGYTTRAFTFVFPSIGSMTRTFTEQNNAGGNCTGYTAFVWTGGPGICYWKPHDTSQTTVVPEEAATCTEDGHSEWEYCDYCQGAVRQCEIYPATGHQHLEADGYIAPTCEENGYSGLVTCTDCGAVIDEGSVIPPTHTPLTELEEEPATCTEEGHTARIICSVCGALLEESEVIPAAGHTEAVTKEAVPATCTQPGSTEEIRCSVCGVMMTESEVIPAAGHTEAVTKEAAAASCTKPGNTEEISCSVCGEILQESTEIPATGHLNPVEVADTAPTCTLSGVTGMIICADCGMILDPGIAIPANGHTETITKEAVPATCTQPGSTARISCSVCGEVLQESETIPAAGHEEIVTKEAVAATCTQPGSTEEISCSVCGEMLTQSEIIPATGHQEEVTKEAVPATCTQPGCTAQIICSVCHEILQESVEIPATGHIHLLEVEDIAPTCVQNGVTGMVVCTDCGTIVNTGTAVPAVGHKETVTKEAVPATCTQPGSTEEISCSVCGEVLTQSVVIPAAGHQEEVTKEAVEATCTQPGSTEEISCTVCGEVLTQSEIIPATGHQEEVTKEAVPATCTQPGSTAQIICSVCEETLQESEEIPATGHIHLVEVEDTAPTCVQNGITGMVVCTDCGTIVNTGTAVPAVGHKEIVTKEAVPATCTQPGSTEEISCSVCGEVLTESEAIPAKGHTWVFRDDPETDQYGNVLYLKDCSVCGLTEVDRVEEYNDEYLDNLEQLTNIESVLEDEDKSIQEKLYELTALDNDALTDAVNYFSDGESTYMGLITQFEDQIINASAGSGDADTATVIPARVEGDSRALVEGAAVSAASFAYHQMEEGNGDSEDVYQPVLRITGGEEVLNEEEKPSYRMEIDLVIIKNEDEEFETDLVVPVRITMSVPEDYKDLDFDLYHHIEKEGEVRKVKTEYEKNEDGTITFTVPSLSPFSFENMLCRNHDLKEDPALRKAATCTDKGLEVYRCQTPHCTYKEVHTLPAAGHALHSIEKTVVKNSAAVLVRYQTCKKCGKTVSQKDIKTVFGPSVKPAQKALKLKGKKILVRWKTVDGASGYEIQYATSKKFKKPKTVKAGSASASSIKTGKVKKKKTYYVRVRAYKDVDGVRVYSSWSKTKKLRIK